MPINVNESTDKKEGDKMLKRDFYDVLYEDVGHYIKKDFFGVMRDFRGLYTCQAYYKYKNVEVWNERI